MIGEPIKTLRFGRSPLTGTLITPAQHTHVLFKHHARAERADGLPRTCGIALGNAIVAHDGPNADIELLAWSRFHRNPGVRQGAMSALVHDGHAQEVGNMLVNEPDPQVKDAVGRLLL